MADPNAAATRGSDIVRWLLTGAVVVVTLVFFFLAYLQRAPQIGSDGKVIFDPFVRTKLLVDALVPLATLALGYWFGNRGADKAEANATKATAENKLLRGALAPADINALITAYPQILQP